MSYTIHCTGLICFIRRVDTAVSYLAAMPDGRAVRDPKNTMQTLQPHDPYLVVRSKDSPATTNWAGNARRDMLFLPIDPGSLLIFDYAADIGVLDDSDFVDHAYSWTDIDPAFRVDPVNPSGTIATSVFANGNIRAFRQPNGSSMIVQIDVSLRSSIDRTFTVTQIASQTRSVVLNNNAQIVLANVSRQFIRTDVPADAEEDFYIYYQLNAGGGGSPTSRTRPSSTTRRCGCACASSSTSSRPRT